ncbi:MAG: exosortase E/protease, VPEID-CTERM system [Natronohydrobacter sp.]|nr:exosortase E/protease, VPEID-CTERM system [Natronohydrobacter sp.]
MFSAQNPNDPTLERTPMTEGLTQHRALYLAGLVLAQLIALAGLYQFVIEIDCGATGSFELCRGLRSALGRSLALLTGIGVLVLARPAIFAAFARRAAITSRITRLAGLATWAGFAVLLLPALILAEGAGPAEFARAVPIWLLGGALIIPATLRWVAPWSDWAWLLRQLGWLGAAVLAFVMIMPELAQAVQPLWNIQALTFLTFALVFVLLRLLGTDAFADPETFVLGVEDFAVHIAAQCSGVEGFVLVGGFVALYAVLFHATIRHGRFWLIVLPLALLASWVLNIIRIAVLVLLGAHVSPQLAVDGFHSYAGWIFFTLLALAILALVHRSNALHRVEARAPSTPITQDMTAAQILPFVAFMVSGLIAAALFDPAALGYPLRVAIMCAAVLPFLALLRALPWQIDPLSWGLGAAVGVLWIVSQGGASASGAELAAMLGGMSLAAAVVWSVSRLIGTVLLVPLIEELFFRGYILSRLDGDGWPRKLLAVAVSTAVFAVLHGRYLEATLAGLVFAWCALRRGRVTDAVQAHIAANAIVALGAVITGDWGLI